MAPDVRVIHRVPIRQRPMHQEVDGGVSFEPARMAASG